MTIGAATSTGSPTVAGIVVGSSTTAANVYKNRIYGITSPATGTSTLLEGIRIAGGTTINVHNNLIGNLNATAVSSNDAIRVSILLQQPLAQPLLYITIPFI